MDIGKFIELVEEWPESFPQEWITEPVKKENEPA